MGSKKRILIKIARIVAFSVVMCAVMVGLFYLYYTGVPKIIAELEEKGKMENTITAMEYLSPMFNVAGLIVALVLIYKLVKAPVHEIQREKGIIMLIVAVFTYGVILPYVLKESAGCFLPVPEGEEDVVSLLETTASWFVVQLIPFMITITYHFMRASRKTEDKMQAHAEAEVTEETLAETPVSDTQNTED